MLGKKKRIKKFNNSSNNGGYCCHCVFTVQGALCSCFAPGTIKALSEQAKSWISVPAKVFISECKKKHKFWSSENYG